RPWGRARPPPGQRRPGVAAVGLGGPYLIEPQPLGRGEYLRRAGGWPGTPVADGGRDLHLWPPALLFPPPRSACPAPALRARPRSIVSAGRRAGPAPRRSRAPGPP